ncbi:hypothetical protein CHLNCDRAFT_33853 [Chlorella variabilis]|uniref:EH domain-containing protein 1 n=1 Tax=Chlorella variabilis TaxID=554065 RepID=E1Z4T0_CHLVA|nr:hypothetical protein CHLNCDRAFT_33853 [Chlorella variabilis]EFN59109.1 hypothetical protein CHLNCDRAFT_33853 [Chlorella variabilis]|eukprot:XP_005851211.1 hypothetical protein CHLNCDRAFT_33853 [Chlorella variabilis]
MGSGVGAVFPAAPPGAATPPPPLVSSAAGTPSKLVAQELYWRWFQMADTDRDGRLTGADAVRFFERSGLARELLAKVWANSDHKRQGFLDFHAFVRALELVSLAQSTGEVSMDTYANMQSAGIEPPRLRGLETDPAAPATAPHASALPRRPAGAESSPSPASAAAMFGRKGKRRAALSTKDCTSITEGLKKIYFHKIRPLEESYKFGHFFSPLLSEGDFEAKPSVLLLGQYSTGKSTFIKYLLGRDYPGIHIGPEPTTDRFVVVMHGPDERRTPGNTLVVQPDKPFTGLAQFGSGFLSKFECAQCDNRLLEEVTLVDTPGVLSGEKQRIERSYDFIQVCGWFAARCDLILLLFDPYKLDISDEFKAVGGVLRRLLLHLLRCLAPPLPHHLAPTAPHHTTTTPPRHATAPVPATAPPRSFNASQPIRDDVNPTGRALFEKEQEDLLHDLYDIPARSCDRRINEFVKRVRAAKIHFLIMGHLRKQIPYFGQKKAQEKLLENLAQEFQHVQREFHLHPGDFPDVERYREILSAFDLSRFPKLDKAMIRQVDDALSLDIPALVRQMDNPWSS